MKRQIRRGVFETNSSSTHSLTMCLKSDYEDDYLESYYDEFTTKSGETVVAFGYYGHD